MNALKWFDNLDILKISGVAFVILSLISTSLWFSYDPVLPKCPLIGEATFSKEYSILDFGLSILTTIILLFALWVNNRRLIILGLAFLVLICTLDLNRANAITYFFFCLWSMWLLTNADKNLYRHCIVIFLSAIYFWSGVHKWNVHFFGETYQWLMNLMPLTRGLMPEKWFSILLPALESIPALMLLWTRSRKQGVILLLIMHIYIIYFMTIIEWGRGIIIWNLLMISLLMHIYNFQERSMKLWQNAKLPLRLFLAFITIIFPLLFCFDKVTSEIAYSMYCGRYMTASIAFTSHDKSKLDKKYYPYLVEYQNFHVMDMDNFGFNTYESELCRTEFALEKMFRKLSEPYSDSCMMVITRNPMFSAPEYEYVYKE